MLRFYKFTCFTYTYHFKKIIDGIGIDKFEPQSAILQQIHVK